MITSPFCRRSERSTAFTPAVAFSTNATDPFGARSIAAPSTSAASPKVASAVRRMKRSGHASTFSISRWAAAMMACGAQP